MTGGRRHGLGGNPGDENPGRARRGAGAAAAILALVLFLAGLPPARAGAVGCMAQAAGIAAEGGDAVSGNVLRLAGGAALFLDGIEAPWSGVDAEQARRALQALAAGKALKVLPAEGGSDRHGRLPAQVFSQSGDSWRWVQGELVAMGLARVAPFADNHGCAARLMEREAQARGLRRGLWRDGANAIRDAEDVAALTGLIDSFQIVEGKVLSVGSSGRHIYLNFGRQWKSDFTARLAAGKAEAFRTAGHDLLGLAGKTVRVRGWLEERGGPMIELEQPMQIELGGKHD